MEARFRAETEIANSQRQYETKKVGCSAPCLH
jgi:hypothetical protein